MKYTLTAKPGIEHCECLVLGLLNDEPWPSFVSVLDKKHRGLLTRLKKKLRQTGDSLWQSDIDEHAVFMIHCGDSATYTREQLDKTMKEIALALGKQSICSALICLPPVTKCTPNTQIQQMILQLEASRYQLSTYKSQPMQSPVMEEVQFFLPHATKQAVDSAEAIAEGMALTKNLANAPANVCTPSYLAQTAIDMAQTFPTIKTTVYDRDQITAMGMGSFLAVAQGSHEPPKFIEIQYHSPKADKMPPVVLVGKGITFDSGGISIKPAENMHEMKYDMAGAASVLGAIHACARMGLAVNVVGLIPTTENMPGGGAVKPGDIVKSMSGKTIEITNTDAEGRLILADALTYAERFKPQWVIDIATLTGAVLIALGNINTGLMTKDDDLATTILHCARESGDKTWRLPLEDAYQESMNSPIADMLNANFDRLAGTVTASCFLSRFTEKYRWAHLDIAGTAWISGKQRQATGRPVPLLVQLLRHVADSR